MRGEREMVMGREVRMVPPNWEHPKQNGSHYGRLQPMYDESFSDAWKDWLKELDEWRAKYPSGINEDGIAFIDWHASPPDRKYYRPWNDNEATWFQLWETVSEGTPVSPPFATKEELAQHLSKHGTFWDNTGWGIEKARAFVEEGLASSMMVMGGKIFESQDIPLHFKKEK